jgi:hypothetical protein
MKQPTEPLSLARIHDVYSGTSVKRETSDKKLSYQTTQRFAREAGHTGLAPGKPLAPNTRHRR